MRTLIDLDDAPVFAIATASGVREGVLVEGPQGWGEFSPPAGSDDDVAARWLTAAMEPSTVGWPDPVRGRVPVCDGARRPVVEVDDVSGIDVALARIWRLGETPGGIEFVVLECRDAATAKLIRQRVDIPVAADAELLAHDPQCADIAVLRCGALGGVRRALRRADKLGLPAVVHFSGITSIGLAADVALAAALPELPYPCGPAPAWLDGYDVVSPSRSLVPADGYLPAAPTPAAPDPERLARVAVDEPATVERWHELLRRAAAVL